MNPLLLFVTLLVQRLYPTWASPHLYRNIYKQEYDKLEECVNLTAHYSSDKALSANIKGCTINGQFTHSILDRILNGTEILAHEIPISFNAPMKQVVFHMHPKLMQVKGDEDAIPTKEYLYSNPEHKKTQRVPPCDYFFTTTDGKFLITSITKREFQDFSKDLSEYANHMAMNPSSLLVRVIGMFEVNSMYFSNYLAPFDGANPEQHYAFEIPNSDIGILEYGQEQKQGFLPMGLSHWHSWTQWYPYLISTKEGKPFWATLHKDMEFLRKYSCVNYQLLITIPFDTDRSELRLNGYDPHINVHRRNDPKFVHPMSVSITHFFHRSRKALKPQEYEMYFGNLIRKYVVT